MFASVKNNCPKWLRLTVVALLALASLSVYILFMSDAPLAVPPSAVDPRTPDQRRLDRLAWAIHYRQTNYSVHLDNGATLMVDRDSPATAAQDQARFTPEQELAALVGFLAAHTHHALPAETNPHEPLHPALILDFDARGERGQAELVQMAANVWKHYPTVVFGKKFDPATKRLRAALNEAKVKATVFELDMRDDGEVIQAGLHRLTSSTSLPILLVNGKLAEIDVRKQGADALLALLEEMGVQGSDAVPKRKSPKKKLNHVKVGRPPHGHGA